MGGDTPRINVEFTEDINAGILIRARLSIAWLLRNIRWNRCRGGTDVVIDIFKTSDANGDGTENT